MSKPLFRNALTAAFAVAIAMAGTTSALADSSKNQIHSVSSTEKGAKTVVRIRGSKTPTFTVYKLPNPERVVVDVSGAKLASRLAGADGKKTWRANTWAVGDIAAHERKSGARKGVRVVVSLARKASYRVHAEGTDVVVSLTARQARPASTASGDLKARKQELARLRREIQAQREATAKESARLAQARRSAKTAAREAKRARQQARVLVERAEAERAAVLAESKRAREEVQRLKSEADSVRAKVAADRKQAARDMKRANAALAQAQTKLGEAERAKREAKSARIAANQMKSRAKAAESQAGAARRQAERAASEAARLRRKLASMADQRSTTADKLRRQADVATKAAEQRRLTAEAAARAAEAKRAQAENSVLAARARSKSAKAAAESAEQARSLANARRREAEQARALAVARRERSEESARAAAKRAKELRAAVAEAKRQAARANRLRRQEEVALKKAESVRRNAEAGQREAVAASSRLEASLKAARIAEGEAWKRKEAAAKAAKRAESYAARSNGSGKELERLRKLSNKLSADSQNAAKALAEQKALLKKRRHMAAKLARVRDRAQSDLESLRAEADKLRQKRRSEEQQLSALVARRDKLRRDHVQARRDASARETQLASRLSKAREARLTLESRLAKSQSELARIRREVAAARSEAKRIQKESARLQNEAAMARVKADREVERVRSEAAAARAEADREVIRVKEALASERKSNARLRAQASEIAVKDVDLVRKPSVSRLVIALTGPAVPKVTFNRGKRAELVIRGAKMSKKLRASIDGSKRQGEVRGVRFKHDKGELRVLVDLKHASRGVLKRAGNTYYWDFPDTKALAKATPVAKPRTRTKTRSFPSPVLSGTRASSAPITQASVARIGGKRRKVYRGRKIDLDYKDADIHNLLRMMADVGRVNIVVPDAIKAKVTVRLRSVPWDQAMEVILASKGLWYRREGRLIRIAPRKELDAEDKAEAERVKALAQSEAPEPEIFTLNYAAANQVRNLVLPLASPKGKIEVDPRTNSLIINDIRAHRRRIVDLIQRLDTQTPQIQIEARIVEARSNFVRDFGIQWGGNFNASTATGNSTGLVFPNSVGIAGAANDGQTTSLGVNAVPTDFAVNLPAAIGTGSGGGLGFAFGSVGGNFNLNLRISALEDIGTARIVSSPKIKVSNNETATISQGVSIPISVVSANGVQTQFVQANLSLRVQPYVSQRDCSVAMDLTVTNNQADFANTGARGDPSILRREARTKVLVADGETTVIGGIYTRNTGRSYSKVPFFADLPVIGYLFKKRRENDERAEVLVFVTPKITNRAFLRCEE